MKKLSTLFLTIVTIAGLYANEPVRSSQTSTCPSFSCANGAGDTQNGNMFDITALTVISIYAFEALPSSGTSTYELYYKAGSFVGFENNPSAWTLFGTVPNVYSSIPNLVYLPVSLMIPAGQTYGLYITTTNPGVTLYNTFGTQTGNVFSSNSDLVFMEGVSLSYPFGTVFQPRIFTGGIEYCQGPLSTNNLENKLIATNVFPNPVSGKAKISFDNSLVNGPVTVEAISLLGEKIFLPQSIQSDGIDINTQSLSAGIYRFVLIDEKNRAVGNGKFCIQ